MTLPLISRATGYGNYADRPTAAQAQSGRVFVATDKDMANYSDGSNWRSEFSRAPTVQIATQAGDTLASISAYTSFATTHTVAANEMVAGRVVRVFASGVFSLTVVPSSPVSGLRLVFGSGPTAIVAPSTVPGTWPNDMTDEHWELNAILVFRSVGASGQVWPSGHYLMSISVPLYYIYHSTYNFGAFYDPHASAVTWDTTASQALAVQAYFDTSSASNTITMNQFIVEYLGGT